MSLADIFKIQQAYNLNNTFKDQTNWQDAFKMANQFADTAEKHRANQENMLTSAYRVGAMNAQNKQKIDLAPFETKANIAKAHYDTSVLPARAQHEISTYGDTTATEAQRRAELMSKYYANTSQNQYNGTQSQAQLDFMNWYGKNAIDPFTGAIKTPEQMMTEAAQSGMAEANPALMAQFITPAQKYLQHQSRIAAMFDAPQASIYRATGGMSDFHLNNNGEAVNSAGNVIGPVPEDVRQYVASGTLPDTGGSRSSALEATLFRAQKDDEKRAAELFEDVFNNSTTDKNGVINQADFDQGIRTLIAINPELAELIYPKVAAIYQMNRWQLPTAQ